jgi:hypothetical protein
MFIHTFELYQFLIKEWEKIVVRFRRNEVEYLFCNISVQKLYNLCCPWIS